MKSALLAIIGLAFATPSLADVVVDFNESAPKDRFTIRNSGACPLEEIVVTIDLGASVAGLIFDVTGAGAGVSVYQPLEIVSGQEFLREVPLVRDGDTRAAFSISTLAPQELIAFTIDVDDTAGVSETMVSGAEIKGAVVTVAQRGTETMASFDEHSSARVPFSSCNA